MGAHTERILGGYDPPDIGLGSEEFRRIINSGISLMAATAIVSYAWDWTSRSYVPVVLPGLIAVNMAARYAMRAAATRVLADRRTRELLAPRAVQ